jgi:hypothetical protein
MMIRPCKNRDCDFYAAYLFFVPYLLSTPLSSKQTPRPSGDRHKRHEERTSRTHAGHTRTSEPLSTMLSMTAVTTCAFMLPCAPIQIPSAVTRNSAPPRMGWRDELPAKLIAGGVALILFSSVTAIVEPGDVGIVTTLGAMSPAPLQAGFHFKSPMADVRTFSVKTVLTEEKTTVPTKEGLSIELDTALLYRLEPEKVQSLILSVGSDFERVVVQPEVRSIIRGLTSEVEAKALYTSGRGELQRRLKEDLSEALWPRSMVLKIPKC